MINSYFTLSHACWRWCFSDEFKFCLCYFSFVAFYGLVVDFLEKLLLFEGMKTNKQIIDHAQGWLFRGHPLLSGHQAIPRGWPLDRGSTLLSDLFKSSKFVLIFR